MPKNNVTFFNDLPCRIVGHSVMYVKDEFSLYPPGRSCSMFPFEDVVTQRFFGQLNTRICYNSTLLSNIKIAKNLNRHLLFFYFTQKRVKEIFVILSKKN